MPSSGWSPDECRTITTRERRHLRQHPLEIHTTTTCSRPSCSYCERVSTKRDVPVPVANMAEILDKVRDALEMTIVCLLPLA